MSRPPLPAVVISVRRPSWVVPSASHMGVFTAPMPAVTAHPSPTAPKPPRPRVALTKLPCPPRDLQQLRKTLLRLMMLRHKLLKLLLLLQPVIQPPLPAITPRWRMVPEVPATRPPRPLREPRRAGATRRARALV
jgi:hypothetical protein